MIVQDVTALPTFNPHSGPITHSSTGSKPDSPVHPLFPRLFLAPGLVCNSRATFREIINSGIRHHTYSRCFEPLPRPVTGIERLPARSKLPMIPPYFALDIFLSLNSRVTSAIFLDVIDQIVDLAEVCPPGFPTLYSFVSTMEFPKKGCRLHHDDLEQRNEDINERDQPLRKDNQDREDSLGFSLPATSPPTPLLKSRDEISCSGGEL